MPTHPRRTRRSSPGWLGTVLAGTALVALVPSPVAAAPPAAVASTAAPGVAQPTHAAQPAQPNQAARPDQLGKHDSGLLAEAIARGEKTVELMLATGRGQTAAVAAGITARGGTVRYRNDRVGYLRAEVPASAVGKAANQAGVVAADIGEVIAREDPAEPGVRKAAVTAAPTRGTPDANPYLPTGETGSVAFKQTRGRDGTGVTIGVLDSGIDLGHPALRRTSTGEDKIVGSFSATDPLLDGDLTWFDLSAPGRVVTGPGRVTLSASGVSKSYALPTGTFRARMRLESLFGAPYDGDLNRDGDTTDVVAVLWDEQAGTVRVDRNLNQDFTDDAPMRDFSVGRQSSSLGIDNPVTAIRESVPFSVQIDPVAKAVNLGIVTDSHGTHVAGIVAGKGLYGGASDGQAPGAKLVSVQVCLIGGGCTAHALVEGMIYAVQTAKVDVVNMSIGGLPALNDGNNVRAEIYNRLIREEGVQILISAGNDGPGVNTVGDPSVATDVVSVAAGISRATWRANYGADVSADQALFNFSARGPREDGGWRPTLSAPGSAISTIPTWKPGQPVAEAGYPLPPGYAMFNGTSMSSPQAAGATALLIGAAKQDKVVATPPFLRAALTGSATFNPAYGVHDQGFGRINVPAAYDLLKRVAARRAAGLDTFTSSAPVCTPLAAFLAVPARGTGLYNRCATGSGGQAVGETRSYPVTINRTSGGSGSYAVRWLGNDGTFSAPQQVRLTNGRAVSVTVTARITSVGTHSALMLLDDPQTPQVDAAVMTTVVSAGALVAPTYSLTATRVVERNRDQHVFVTVPVGAPYLRVNLGGTASGSQVRFIANTPYGVPVEQTSSLNCYTNRPLGGDCAPTSRTYADPLPGIWEFVVEARRTTPQLQNPFTLSAQLLGVTVNPAVTTVATATRGAPTPLSWRLTNRYAPATVGATGSNLGSALRERKTIAAGAEQTFTVVVPPGADSLSVRIGNPSDVGADLDLSVLGPGGEEAQSADGDSEEAVRFASPASGTWTVTVAGYAVPTGTTAYDYLDVFVSPALGALTVTDTPAPRTSGASWTVAGAITAQQAPVAGRALFGQVLVRTADGTVVGSGDVLVQAVS